MKKIILTVLMILLFAGLSYGETLEQGLNIQDFSLSTNVEGLYFTNATQSAYSIATANDKGDKVYGGGSFVSEIYEKDIAGAIYVSSDLSIADDDFDSDTYSAWTAK